MKKPLGSIEVAWLRRDDENGVDALHRQHLDTAGERAFALRLHDLFQLPGEFGRVAITDREQRVRSTGQNIDIERTNKPSQRLANRGVAADQHRVGCGISCDFAALPDIRLKHFGKVSRGGITQRYDFGPGADRVCTAREITDRPRRNRHDVVDPVADDKRRSVSV